MDLAVERDAHDRGLQAVAVAHADGQVWLARHRVDGHPVHHQAFRRHAQRCGDLLVDRLEEEGIQRGWRLASFRLEGENRPEHAVADEQDPVGTERQGSGGSRGDLVDRAHDGLLAAFGGCLSNWKSSRLSKPVAKRWALPIY